MQQITITVDLTPENLEILKQLCGEAPRPVRTKKEAPKPTPTPAPTPAEPTEKTIELQTYEPLHFHFQKPVSRTR